MRRTSVRIVEGLFATAMVVSCAVFTTTLQSVTVAAWDQYIGHVEQEIATGAPPLAVTGDAASLSDLNPNGTNAGEDIRGGYIHDWIGAVLIPNSRVDAVEAVLESYGSYTRVYGPGLKSAAATKTGGGARERDYDVRLVTERVEGMGVHFAFDLRSHVTFRKADGEARVDSRSYQIRESNRGKAPYTDLLPEGNDHGIVWRLNSYWRLRQMGTSVYAECRVISLSRKPLPGTRDLVKSRARESLETTLMQTRAAVAKAGG